MNQNSKRGRAKKAEEHAQKAHDVEAKETWRTAIWTGWFLHAETSSMARN